MAISELTSRSMTPAPFVVAGRYELRGRLGRGSSATLYAAIDLRFNRAVTVKLFDPSIAASPTLRTRFERQVAKSAGLIHRNIARVLDAGFASLPDGPEQPFVVTEVAGEESLRAVLERRGKLGSWQAIRVAEQVAEALAYAHRQGIVHADVKPENVLLDETGQQARLVDFSLSFVSAGTGAVTPATIARRAAYLAPEQVQAGQAGPAADIYALGVLLYEMLVGRPPFVADTPRATAERRLSERARPAGLFDPSVPPGLEAVLARALERDPGRRWPTVESFAAALHRASSAPAPRSPAAPEGPATQVRGDPGRSPLATVVPALVVLLLVGVALVFMVPFVRNGLKSGPTAPMARVPDMTGMTVPEARSLAGSRGFQVIVIGDRVTDRDPRDRIVQQSPIAGWEASDQPIRVTVSAGVRVPDVRGKSLENATAALTELGWRVARVERGSFPGQPSGTVVLQSPAPNEVAPGPGELLLAIAQ